MRYATSPYLPGWEYVPDAEPHVFGERLYVYGSHDRFAGKKFCMNDYVCWSAPLSDLADWRYEGVIYCKEQDPDNVDGKLEMFAPDVCQGTDGRYYLYYCLADHDKLSVAVSNTPAGKYEFYGYVRDKDGNYLGTRAGEKRPFDPAVLVDDDGRIHLYEGQSPMDQRMARSRPKMGDYAYHMELEPDMLTLRTQPKPLVPNYGNSAGTGFEGHEFHEGSSIRKFGGKYYFIYSSVLSHELCWSVSKRPDGGFRYGGTLVSNGDIGLEGPVPMTFNSKANLKVKNYVGNTHGSVIRLGENYYVFYHRHTNRHMLSRQGCVTKIQMLPDGSFLQAEMTSCGLADTLPGKGTFEARIACQLYSKMGCVFSAHPMVQNKKHPAFTQDEPDGKDGVQYIANLRDGATAVFKYFQLEGSGMITVTVRGKSNGKLLICAGDTVAAEIALKPSKQWTKVSAPFAATSELTSLAVTYQGPGYADFLDFTIS